MGHVMLSLIASINRYPRIGRWVLQLVRIELQSLKFRLRSTYYINGPFREPWYFLDDILLVFDFRVPIATFSQQLTNTVL